MNFWILISIFFAWNLLRVKILQEFLPGGIYSLFMGSYWVKIDFEKVNIVVTITRNVTHTSIFLITELPFQVLTILAIKWLSVFWFL